MKTLQLQDHYNPSKVWLIKRSTCHHWYISQAIDGQRLYAFQRCTKFVIRAVTGRTNKEIKQLLKGA